MPNSVYKDKINRIKHIKTHIFKLIEHYNTNDCFWDEVETLNNIDDYLTNLKELYTERR